MADRPLFIRLSMPSGLEEALEGLTREVLRSQPKDINDFAATYFENLLKRRNEEEGLPTDDLYGLKHKAPQKNGSEPEIDLDMEDPELDKAATKIQAGFRGSQARKEVGAMRQEHVEEEDVNYENNTVSTDNVNGTTVDQKTEEVVAIKEESKPEEPAPVKAIAIQLPTQDDGDEDIIEEAPTPAGEEEEEIDIDLEDPEVEAAATKIQASFKGHKTRKEMKEKKDVVDKADDEIVETVKEEKETEEEEEIDIDLDDPEVEAAATKIQAGFKGHKTRKEMKEKKERHEVQAEPQQEPERKISQHEIPKVRVEADEETVEIAATTIQYGYKQYKANSLPHSKSLASEEVPKPKEKKTVSLDMNDPEVEDAITTIQAGFKGFKAKQDLENGQEEEKKPEETENAPVVQEESKPDDEIDIDLEDPEVETAATKIQASFKGHKTRKEMKEKKDGEDKVEETKEGVATETAQEEVKEEQKAEEEEIDIDLEDPEVEAAATKIQASFKGHKTRKEMKEKKDGVTEEALEQEESSAQEEAKVEEEEVDIDLEDPEVAAAATKIQAGYKGHMTRKEMKEKKDTDMKESADKKEDIGEQTKEKEIVDAGAEKLEEEEEIDIDLEDPEVEAAATKIQAGFKGHKTRKEMKEKKEKKETSEMETVPEETQEPKAESKPEEEEIDIDLEDPEVEAAATKIQASFKGHQTRKEMKAKKEEDGQVEAVKEESTEQTKEVTTEKDKEGGKDEEEEIDIDLEDPEVEAAATKIQASFKGHKTRKEMKEKKEGDGEAVAEKIPPEEQKKAETDEAQEEKPKPEEEEVDIDLEDPEVAAAATKIQAGYKGHMTRKEMKEKKEETTEEATKTEEETVKKETTAEADEEIDIDLEDPEVEAAATKIQAGFKGHKTRKEMKEKQDAGEKKEGDQPEAEVKEKDIVEEKQVEKTVAEEEEVDIDLEDPEVAAAATKIQAGYKGHMTRKEMKEKKETEEKQVEGEVKVEETKQEDVADAAKPEEEEIDIDLEDPEVAAAATKIQAGYKGHMTRKEMKKDKTEGEATVEEKAEEKSDTKETDTVMEKPAEPEKEEEIDIDPEVEAAATKIQASFKGHKTRKEMNEKKDGETEETQQQLDEVPEKKEETKAEEEEVDIDLEDPEVAAAATKIQAGYKGHMTRKGMKEKKTEDVETVDKEDDAKKVEQDSEVKEEKPSEGEDAKPEEEEIDIDLEDPEVEAAATKIQASFKGHQTRKEMKAKTKDTAEERAKAEEAKDEPAKKEEEQEEIDIDLEDPEVAAAATKIQAGYKGHMTRKEMKDKKDGKDGEDKGDKKDSDDKPVEVTEKKEGEEEEIDIDLDDPEVEAAATKIQAGFKGHKTRKEMKEKKETTDESDKKEGEGEEKTDTDKDKSDDKKEDIEGAEVSTEMLIQGAASTEGNEDVQLESHGDDGYNSPDAMMSTTTASSIQGSPQKQQPVSLALTGTAAQLHDPGNMKMFSQESVTDSDMIDASSDITQNTEDKNLNLGITAALLEDLEEEAGSMPSSILTVAHMDDYNEAEVTMTEEGVPVVRDELKELVDSEVSETPSMDKLEEKSDTLDVSKQADPEEKEEEVKPIPDQEAPIQQEPVQEEVVQAVQVVPADAVPFTDADIRDPDEIEGEQTPTILDQEEPIQQIPIPDLEEPLDVSKPNTAANDEAEDKEIFEEISSAHKADTDNGMLDTVTNVAAAGAVPFERHISHPDVPVTATNDGDTDSITKLKESEQKQDTVVMLYHSQGSWSSEKVLVYLYERNIEFSSFNIDLSKGEQFSKWFLKINPKGEVPALTIRSKGQDPTDPKAQQVITDSTRIIHSLETKFNNDFAPPLVPSPRDTVLYQLHVYFTALFEQIPLNIISHGVAFHDHLAMSPDHPFTQENYEAIQNMVKSRAQMLKEAADSQASYAGDTDTAVMELRMKANQHAQTLHQYTDLVEFRKHLKQTGATLDKVEGQLEKTMGGDSEDDCEGWLLGIGFSAVDITLGVILNRLARLGLSHYFWSHGKRPFVHKFLRQIHRRPSFSKAISRLPPSEVTTDRPLKRQGSSMESRLSLDEMNVFVEMEDTMRSRMPQVRLPTKESLEVYGILNEAKREDDIRTEAEDKEVFKVLTTHPEEPGKTWRDLWTDEKKEDK